LLTDRGLSGERAISVLSSFGVGGIVGQLASGYLLDRYESPRVAVPFFVSALAGLILLTYGSGFTTLLAAGLLLRIGVGAELSMAPYLLARYFGLRSFGEIYGVLFLLATIAGGLGPVLMGWCFDATGSYGLALSGFEAAMALSVVLISLLGPYLYAVRPPDEAVSHHGATAPVRVRYAPR
jgi:MFS family permease